MKIISATILGVSLVIGASLMKPPRYQHFDVQNREDRAGRLDQEIHGVLDTKTGTLCYHAQLRPEGFLPDHEILETEARGNESYSFVNCEDPFTGSLDENDQEEEEA